jgi:hypothetical protein
MTNIEIMNAIKTLKNEAQLSAFACCSQNVNGAIVSALRSL